LPGRRPGQSALLPRPGPGQSLGKYRPGAREATRPPYRHSAQTPGREPLPRGPRGPGRLQEERSHPKEDSCSGASLGRMDSSPGQDLGTEQSTNRQVLGPRTGQGELLSKMECWSKTPMPPVETQAHVGLAFIFKTFHSNVLKEWLLWDPRLLQHSDIQKIFKNPLKAFWGSLLATPSQKPAPPLSKKSTKRPRFPNFGRLFFDKILNQKSIINSGK
jgi:hypothetical protein